MLVLTRKQSEKIQIGDNITVTVIRTKGKAVRLGIEAPSNLRVLRGELLFDSSYDEADIHCESDSEQPSNDQSAEDTILECRIPRDQHQKFVV